MSQPPYHESAVDRAIREAQERGEFDNLRGAGKPLKLGDTHDPDWWIKQYVEREQLDLGDALPGALGLRREASRYPDSLVEVATEARVREIIEDYNRRVLADRLRPAVGSLPPVVARTLDVDEMVSAWRELRAAAAERRASAATEAARAEATARENGRGERAALPWWRRPFKRR